MPRSSASGGRDSVPTRGASDSAITKPVGEHLYGAPEEDECRSNYFGLTFRDREELPVAGADVYRLINWNGTKREGHKGPPLLEILLNLRVQQSLDSRLAQVVMRDECGWQVDPLRRLAAGAIVD